MKLMKERSLKLGLKILKRALDKKAQKGSFFNAVLWGAYFKLKHDQNDFAHDEEKLKEVLGVDFLQKFIEIRDEIRMKLVHRN